MRRCLPVVHRALIGQLAQAGRQVEPAPVAAAATARHAAEAHRLHHRLELGLEVLERVKEDLSDIGKVESEPSFEGRVMFMVMAPLKTK